MHFVYPCVCVCQCIKWCSPASSRLKPAVPFWGGLAGVQARAATMSVIVLWFWSSWEIWRLSLPKHSTSEALVLDWSACGFDWNHGPHQWLRTIHGFLSGWTNRINILKYRNSTFTCCEHWLFKLKSFEATLPRDRSRSPATIRSKAPVLPPLPLRRLDFSRQRFSALQRLQLHHCAMSSVCVPTDLKFQTKNAFEWLESLSSRVVLSYASGAWMKQFFNLHLYHLKVKES